MYDSLVFWGDAYLNMLYILRECHKDLEMTPLSREPSATSLASMASTEIMDDDGFAVFNIVSCIFAWLEV